MLISPDGEAEMLKLPPGLPLGLGDDCFEATEISLPPGATLALYTDGLVEALPAQDRRHPYRLTAAGAEAARSYLQHARQVTATGLARLEGYAW